MKKYILFTILILFGCTQTPYTNVLPVSREYNKNCMDMRRFKVFQVFEDCYALANACSSEYNKDFCIGAVVLLTPQRNIEYYDDMYVSTPQYIEGFLLKDSVYKRVVLFSDTLMVCDMVEGTELPPVWKYLESYNFNGFIEDKFNIEFENNSK